jgi:tRNA1Val (adenine37-N6)-methyltransferase
MKPPFRFKQFSIIDSKCAMKIGTDAVLLGALTDTASDRNILDIGTGCGIIALMLAQKSQAIVDAIDVHQPSCEDARLNFENSPWSGRLRIHHSSLHDFVKITKETYDLIVSNPPFFNKSLNSPFDEKNLAKHSGSLSHQDLLEGVYKLLKFSGHFRVILPASVNENFIKQAALLSLYLSEEIQIIPKTGKAPNRVVLGFIKEKPIKVRHSKMVMRNTDGSFHEDYIALTKDFHLNLH